MTDPNDMLRACALVRAGVESDAESIYLLTREPPTEGLVEALVAVAASTMEKALGHEKAIETLDAWLRVALAGAVVEERR